MKSIKADSRINVKTKMQVIVAKLALGIKPTVREKRLIVYYKKLSLYERAHKAVSYNN
jgi:hypothetical protein